ncbi:MAG: hypothetical protein Kow00129_12430 [Thermoleophilia bacterium]
MDLVLAEPSGLVVPQELRNAIRIAGRDVRVEVGPVVLLLDAGDADGPFADGYEQLTRRQAVEADAIALTKADRRDQEALRALEAKAKDLNGSADYFRVSTADGSGLDALAAYLLNDSATTKEVE